MVVRGLVDKPARIDTPVGTLAEAGNYFTPKLSRRILHQLYLGYPDSAAARGETDPKPVVEQQLSRRPKRPARAVVARMRVMGPVKAAARLVPGVHW
jgi:hypothetical protein